jgi:hypothetical protein
VGRQLVWPMRLAITGGCSAAPYGTMDMNGVVPTEPRD